MIKQGYVYIMASNNNRALYIGVTSDLEKRVWQHKNHYFKDSYTDKYNCEKLVFFEAGSIEAAIEAEKKFKNQSRAFKEKLIGRVNPHWEDLSITLFRQPEQPPARHPEFGAAKAQDLDAEQSPSRHPEFGVAKAQDLDAEQSPSRHPEFGAAKAQDLDAGQSPARHPEFGAAKAQDLDAEQSPARHPEFGAAKAQDLDAEQSLRDSQHDSGSGVAGQ